MKQTEYANEATKQIALMISGCIGIGSVLTGKETFRGCETAKTHIGKMKEEAQIALDAVLEGLDPEQIKGILRYGDMSEMMLIPKSSPIIGKQFYILSDTELETLMKDPLSHCNFCELDGKEARKCPLRKVLLRIGAVDEKDKNGCPYRG